MKREIKFRGMSLIVGFCEWRYGFFSTYPKGAHITTPDGECWPVAIESVGQFTGLKDKNGKEIYEGDILYCSDAPGSHHRVFWNNERCGWDDERLEDGDSNTSYYGFDMFIDCEVIGNIYENPELINK